MPYFLIIGLCSCAGIVIGVFVAAYRHDKENLR